MAAQVAAVDQPAPQPAAAPTSFVDSNNAPAPDEANSCQLQPSAVDETHQFQPHGDELYGNPDASTREEKIPPEPPVQTQAQTQPPEKSIVEHRPVDSPNQKPVAADVEPQGTTANDHHNHHHLHVHHHPHLHKIKARLVQTKNRFGKLKNLLNRNHRHDEPHEKAVDEKRTEVAESNRFESFAGVRDGNEVKWYVDGRDYFWAVSIALENAKDVIYIADWWLSPELFLRRPPSSNKEWRLDQILKRKAEAGVKIYVIVYKEVSQALTCNSQHTKTALEGLCPEGKPGHGNIIAMRHPDHSPFQHAADMTFYWAHHEKFIVIDHRLAFVGGLDLCFGRWDMRQHPLADVHPRGMANEIWPGQDFNNNRVMDFHDVQDWRQNQLQKKDFGRMPWHDVGVGLIGEAVFDISEHFVGRWNFIKRDKYKRHTKYPWLKLSHAADHQELLGIEHPKYPVGGYTTHNDEHRVEELKDRGSCTVQSVRSASDWSHGILTEHSIQNAYKSVIAEAEHFVYIENQFFITATGEEQSPIHNTIGASIVEAILRASAENRKFRVIVVIPAIPGFPGDLRDEAATGTRAVIDYQYKSICRGEHSIMERVRAQGVDPSKYIFFFNLRVYDRLHRTKALEEAEKEANVEYSELQRAHAAEVMGEGGVTQGRGWDDTSSESSIDSDGGSAYGREIAEKKKVFEEKRKQTLDGQGVDENNEQDSIAKDAMSDEPKVLYEPWGGDKEEERKNFINEELYVHAKVLIADDKTVIIGSSNLNDRSQLGNHDSELSLVIEDTNTIDTIMDGNPYKASRFAATLRRQLWREHLGLLHSQSPDASKDINAQPPDINPENDYDLTCVDDRFVEDALGDDLWDAWTKQATLNTDIYRELFHCDPDDNIKTWKDYDDFLPSAKKNKDYKAGHIVADDMDIEAIKEKLSRIQGHLVWMPLEFLKDEELAERGLQVNSWTESIYT